MAPADGERWSLAGTTALVTGGSNGIGHTVVEELAGFGVQVHTCSRSTADLEERRRWWADNGLSVTVSVCDVAAHPDRERLVDMVKATFDGELDILVNNAGLLFFKQATECTVHGEGLRADDGDQPGSCFHLSQLAHPLLLNASLAGGGSVVHVFSIASFVAFPWEASTLLHGQRRTEPAGEEPGCRMGARQDPCQLCRDRIRELSRIPMRRAGEPAVVASLVSFLSMAAASYVTRQLICIDGGRTISA